MRLSHQAQGPLNQRTCSRCGHKLEFQSILYEGKPNLHCPECKEKYYLEWEDFKTYEYQN